MFIAKKPVSFRKPGYTSRLTLHSVGNGADAIAPNHLLRLFCARRLTWLGFALCRSNQPSTSLTVLRLHQNNGGDVSIQDHHRSPSSRPDSAQSMDRGKNRIQRPQPDDEPRYAGCHSHQGKRATKRSNDSPRSLFTHQRYLLVILKSTKVAPLLSAILHLVLDILFVKSGECIEA
jgi:hypothetical protein